MEVKVADVVGSRDLALRFWADELFKTLSKTNDRHLILDFSGVEFMSRSFAHEYLVTKRLFTGSIEEKNMNASVAEMLKLAEKVPNRIDRTDRKHVAAIKL